MTSSRSHSGASSGCRPAPVDSPRTAPAAAPLVAAVRSVPGRLPFASVAVVDRSLFTKNWMRYSITQAKQ